MGPIGRPCLGRILDPVDAPKHSSIMLLRSTRWVARWAATAHGPHTPGSLLIYGPITTAIYKINLNPNFSQTFPFPSPSPTPEGGGAAANDCTAHGVGMAEAEDDVYNEVAAAHGERRRWTKAKGGDRAGGARTDGGRQRGEPRRTGTVARRGRTSADSGEAQTAAANGRATAHLWHLQAVLELVAQPMGGHDRARDFNCA